MTLTSREAGNTATALMSTSEDDGSWGAESTSLFGSEVTPDVGELPNPDGSADLLSGDADAFGEGGYAS